MKKGFLRFIAVAMIVLVAAVYLPASEIDTVFDVEASAGVIAGVAWNDVSLGGKVKWKYDAKNDLITVFGSGNMNNFNNGDDGQNWDALWGGSTEYPINRATKIVIENGITNIGNNAFVGFKELKEVVIPASVKSIGTGAFKNNAKLTKVTIPAAVTVISNDTFSGCSSLSSININEGITSIGSNAFNGTKITSVNMPSSVKSIGNNAFGTVKITCNFGDPGYTYCQKHSNATAVLRTPELKAVVVPSAENQVTAIFYVKNGSGLNAANFKIKYNSDITPVSSDLVLSETSTFLSAVSFGADNTISIGIADANEIPFTSCTGACEYKVAEIVFNFAPGTHAAKFEFSSSVFMLGNQKYTLPAVTADYGEHNYQQSGSPVAPTCTEEGYTLFICSICKDEKREDVKTALGHEYAETVTPPTCEEDGFTAHTCSRCNDTYSDNVVIATGHTLVESFVDATCTEKGKKVLACEVCGASNVIEEYEINPDNHVNTEVINKADATCAVNGYTGDTYCKDCEKTITTGSVITAPGHAEETLPAVAATCTQSGITEGKKCTVCNEIVVAQTEVPATGHTEEVLSAVTPSCTATGLTEGVKCSVCNEILTAQTEVSATGHTEEVLPAVAPSCTATGLTEGKKCTVCNENLVAQTEVPATGHKEEVISAKPATCTATGLTEGKKCTVCNEILVAQTEVPATGHTIEILPAVSVTCTEKGLTEGKKCSVCNEILVAQTEVPATGHKEEILPAVSVTCTEKGFTEGKKCSVCNEIFVAQTEIPATGHTEEILPAVSVTCTTAGITEGKKCTVCNETLIAQTEIAATGHSVEIFAGKPATCTEKGITEGKKCTVCNEILVAQTEIAATGHDYVSIVTPPTCTAQGYTTLSCSRCDSSEVRDYKNALGHNFDDDGFCTRCNEKEISAETILEFKDKTAFAQNDAEKTVIAKNPGTVAQVKQEMINSGWVITDANGNALADDKALTTGCLIKSADGKQVYTYAMLGDVNADGKLSAADARLALRISARLETSVPAMLLAADCDGKTKVSASDARVILRVSAKLQEF